MARSVEHYTAAEAARILRLSSQRVRQLLAERREVLFGALEDPQRLSELEAEVRELRYFLGRAEARLEMPAQLESVLREALKRERERADRLEAELASLLEARQSSPAPRDTSETVPESIQGTNIPTDQGGRETAASLPPETRRTSWRRRFFGFE